MYSFSLQDEFTRAQGELKRLLSDRQAQQEKIQLRLAELRGELLDKTRETEELRLQVNQEISNSETFGNDNPSVCIPLHFEVLLEISIIKHTSVSKVA